MHVAIWGTVAEWFSAIGTGGAAIAAATYYILSARSRKRAQAHQIHATVAFPENGKIHPFNFILYNDSEDQISGFYGRYKERRLIPSLLGGVTFQKMRAGEVEQTGIGMVLLNTKSELVGFDGRQGYMLLTIIAASRVLPPGQSVTLGPGADDRFRWSTVYWIGFLDANGNRWEREVTNSIMTYGRLRKAKKKGYFFEIRAKRRRRRFKHYLDVTRWVWRNRKLQTYSQWERKNTSGMPQT
ncbi:MAG: hypothetical protein P4L48_22100 [Mycobacterium sp.]|nr:hypothetical protein [Mycobacterium sp.]